MPRFLTLRQVRQVPSRLLCYFLWFWGILISVNQSGTCALCADVRRHWPWPAVPKPQAIFRATYRAVTLCQQALATPLLLVVKRPKAALISLV